MMGYFIHHQPKKHQGTICRVEGRCPAAFGRIAHPRVPRRADQRRFLAEPGFPVGDIPRRAAAPLPGGTQLPYPAEGSLFFMAQATASELRATCGRDGMALPNDNTGRGRGGKCRGPERRWSDWMTLQAASRRGGARPALASPWLAVGKSEPYPYASPMPDEKPRTFDRMTVVARLSPAAFRPRVGTPAPQIRGPARSSGYLLPKTIGRCPSSVADLCC